MDLKIKDVAELLHISETTVRRLLNEGQIPSYKINGQYRISRTEIEDWLMRQKPELDNQREKKDTSHLISDLTLPAKTSQKTGNMQFSLYRALYRGTVLSDVPFKSKEDVIRHTMKYMAEHFDLDADVLSDLFLEREKLMSTSLGHGIAVPHTRDFLLSTHFDVIVTVYPKTPINYDALDGQPVHTLFFLFAAEDKNHLHLLSKIAHLSANEKTRAFLATKPTKERLLEFVKHFENSLSS